MLDVVGNAETFAHAIVWTHSAIFCVRHFEN